MNLALFKASLKANYKLIAIFVTVLLFYMLMMVYMYDPESQQVMELYIQSLPQELILAMNFQLVDSSLTGFLAGYFYGFLIIMFPMVLIILITYKSMAKLVDRGSMALLLATPNKRSTIAFTQAMFIVFANTLTFALVFLFGWAMMEMMLPNQIDIGLFFLINLGGWAYFFAISGIGFLGSTMFNDGRTAMSFIVAVPIFFLIVQMLYQITQELSWLQYLTLLTLYQPNEIILGQLFLFPFLILMSIGIFFFTVAIVIFTKKDLAV